MERGGGDFFWRFVGSPLMTPSMASEGGGNEDGDDGGGDGGGGKGNGSSGISIGRVEERL